MFVTFAPKVSQERKCLDSQPPGHEAKDRNHSADSALVKDNLPSRVSQACRACAANHLRCSETKPCQRCLSKEITCNWDDPTSSIPNDTLTPPTTISPSGDLLDSPGNQQNDANLSLLDVFDQTQSVEPNTGGDAARPNVVFPVDVGCSSAHLDTFSPVVEFTGLSTEFVPPFDSYDFDFNTSMELDDMDLEFLNSCNTNVPLHAENFSLPATSSKYGREDSVDSNPQVGINAFVGSQWSFQPTAEDHRAAEEENLSIPTTSSYHSPESRISMDSRNTPKLTTSGRDKIMTIVVNNCSTGGIPKATASFPSVDLLDSLLDVCLYSFQSETKNYIHIPTFDPNKKRPELVTTIIALGAVMTQDPTLVKLGFALQESARAALPKLWEESNIRVRDLELSQCFFMLLKVGLWSGLGRKVEIAESYLQMLITMLRRGGKFKNVTYPTLLVTKELESEALDSAWRRWVEQESFRRLCLQVLQHDSNTSMCFLVNPVASYAEIQLPMRASSALWFAATSHEWKEIYLSLGGQLKTTILADYIDDTGLLNTIEDKRDLLQTSQVLLSCIWRLAWELNQLNSVKKCTPKRWNKLLLASRLDELLQILQHFRLSVEPKISPDIAMSLDCTCLHLHAPIEDIQIFAGIEGPQQSRAVYPLIKTWAGEESARNAVWHAGQVLRFARLLKQQCLQGHLAMILYQAGLVLWVYGLFTKKSPPSESKEVQAVLDAPVNTDIQRFIQLEMGMPSITTEKGDSGIYLCDTDRVMEAVVLAMRKNFEGKSRPFLIEKLVRILTALHSLNSKDCV
ncbi:hypothetical protein QQS21_004603 [Conoideocrella luteorostrata]|uniref:Zn(2)-C6 fungal-type domain-containing protein n=1 Tax=Conoideocrella luteorostrata TaxID=1105319 RepID=A0AAJ0CTF9_9HYPO|nr:hypothetical protein QQS21_004603 [Conoideocrella luteorostrata]